MAEGMVAGAHGVRDGSCHSRNDSKTKPDQLRRGSSLRGWLQALQSVSLEELGSLRVTACLVPGPCAFPGVTALAIISCHLPQVRHW